MKKSYAVLPPDTSIHVSLRPDRPPGRRTLLEVRGMDQIFVKKFIRQLIQRVKSEREGTLSLLKGKLRPGHLNNDRQFASFMRRLEEWADAGEKDAGIALVKVRTHFHDEGETEKDTFVDRLLDDYRTQSHHVVWMNRHLNALDVVSTQDSLGRHLNELLEIRRMEREFREKGGFKDAWAAFSGTSTVRPPQGPSPLKAEDLDSFLTYLTDNTSRSPGGHRRIPLFERAYRQDQFLFQLPLGELDEAGRKDAVKLRTDVVQKLRNLGLCTREHV